MDAHPGNRPGGMTLPKRLSPAARALAVGKSRISGALQLLRSPRKWSELVTRLRGGDRVHQDNSLTFLDRYPVLFGAVRALLADRPSPRILSYGCSSGEETTTLRHYFPAASIVGAEVNRHLLRACRRLPADPDTRFIHSDEETIRAHGPYDAIFCMAVLTRRPHEIEQRDMRDISRFYPFEPFARDIGRLAACLAPGGLLIVEHALYRVEDAMAGHGLVPETCVGHAVAKGPRFAPDGALIAPPPVIARIFRKGPA